MSLEPLNQKERSQAQRRFLGVYLLSIIIPCLAVYFLSKSSDNRLASENAQLKSLLRIVSAMDTVTHEVKTLNRIDEAFRVSSNKELSSSEQLNVDNAEATLRTTINALRRDSASVVANMSTPNQEPASKIIGNLNIYLQNWITIKSLRQIQKQQGNEAAELDKCKAENEKLQAKLDQNDFKKEMAAIAAKAGGGGGGGGGGDDKLKKEVEDLKAQLAEAKAGKSAGFNTYCEIRLNFIEGDGLKKLADQGRTKVDTKEIERNYQRASEKFNRVLELAKNASAADVADYAIRAKKALDDIKAKQN